MFARVPSLLAGLLLFTFLVPAGSVAAGADTTTTTARLGLHVTDVELAEWQARAVDGPYRSAGDVSVNSPGDWSRIAGNARTFAADPGAYRWAGPADPSGCVDPPGSLAYDPDDDHSRFLRDAAFHALVTGDPTLRAAVAAELHAQSQVANLDFADRSRWCLGVIHDLNPGFEIANWLTSLLYALEYVEIGDRLDGSTSLSADASRDVLDWMEAAAEWMNHDIRAKLDVNFTDRQTLPEPPYTLSSYRESNPDIRDEPYAGAGPQIGSLARHYNNRRAAQQRFVGLLGLHLVHRADAYRPAVGALGFTAEDYVADTTRFVKDVVTYTVYAEGFVGEFERWKSTLPDLGWGYAIQALAPVLTYVDALARTGDTSLYGYVTDAGVHNTEGAPAGEAGKHLHWLTRQLAGYLDGAHDRYAPGHGGDPDYRIDGRNPVDGTSWDSVHDVALVGANRFWADPYLEAVHLRTGPGVSPYPSRPAGFGQYSPWTGDWGTFPGVLLMFGSTHHLPSPYGTSADATTDPEPTDEAPIVTIDEPLDGATFDADLGIGLRGAASDAEDGDLSASIAWSSDAVGALGTGGHLTVDLPAGTHTITAEVSDSSGGRASSRVTITVAASEPLLDALIVDGVTAGGEGGRWKNMHLVAGATIVDGDGRAVAGATVVLSVLRNGSLFDAPVGTTDSNGAVSFKWTGVPRGTYEVSVADVALTGGLWDGTSPTVTWTR